MAVDLLAQRARSASSWSRSRWRMLGESHGPATPPRPARRGPRQRRPFGIVFGLVRGNRVGWTSAEVLTALIAGTALVRGLRGLGAAHRRSRCCRCGCSAAAASPPPTWPACSCSSGCSARSSCWPSSCRPCRATRRSSAGLRTLPWTAMPVFVAPIAGALSDRIGGRPLLVVGLAMQATGLAWMAARHQRPTSPTHPAPAVHPRRRRHGLFFAPVANVVLGSRSAATEEGIASGRQQRASASSAACSASPSWPRSSPRTAATRPAQAFVAGLTRPSGSAPSSSPSARSPRCSSPAAAGRRSRRRTTSSPSRRSSRPAPLSSSARHAKWPAFRIRDAGRFDVRVRGAWPRRARRPSARRP